MGTECYIKTQVEIDTHSKIYIFSFFLIPLFFNLDTITPDYYWNHGHPSKALR